MATWANAIDKSAAVAHHVEQWQSKLLHGHWPNLLLDRNVHSSGWVQMACLKPVTEYLVVTAQDQALSTVSYFENCEF